MCVALETRASPAPLQGKSPRGRCKQASGLSEDFRAKKCRIGTRMVEVLNRSYWDRKLRRDKTARHRKRAIEAT